MKLTILLFLLIYTTQVAAQQINGKWKGRMYYTNSNADTVLVEIKIKGKNNNQLSGYSICHFFGGDFANTTITGKFDPLKNEVYLEEKRLVNTNFRDPSNLFLDEYNLFLDTDGKLTGIVRCKGLANKNPGNFIPCHDNLYIELVKQ